MGQPVYTNYFLGDSFTYGVGSSVSTLNWVERLCKRRNWEFLNIAVGGETITPGATGAWHSFNLSSVPVKNRYSQRLISAWGINDSNSGAFSGGATTQNAFITAYTNYFNRTITNGWSYGDLLVVSQYGLHSSSLASHPNYDNFTSALETLCASLGVKYINCKSYMASNGGDSLFVVGGPNDQHPNDTGYQIITDYIDTNI